MSEPGANGAPSDFGFAMVMHPQNPDAVYIPPVESDKFGCTADGRRPVYRTRNAGASWEPLMRDLPQKRAYEPVLRDAMTADTLDPHGIYFGTRSGQLYGSAEEGKNWKRILEGLPAVLCVKSATVAEPRPVRKSKATHIAGGQPSRSFRGNKKSGIRSQKSGGVRQKR